MIMLYVLVPFGNICSLLRYFYIISHISKEDPKVCNFMNTATGIYNARLLQLQVSRSFPFLESAMQDYCNSKSRCLYCKTLPQDLGKESVMDCRLVTTFYFCTETLLLIYSLFLVVALYIMSHIYTYVLYKT